MERSWQDLRLGVRTLRRRPALTLMALLTMTLCIGANTAIFSVVHSVLIAPLPFARPAEIVQLHESAPKLGLPDMACSPLDFEDWRARSRSFSSLGAFHRRRATLTGGGEPLALTGAEVSADFFRTLGVQPLLGRWFGAADDVPGAPRTVVLGAKLWHRQFGGDPAILRRHITLDGASYAVIGIAPSAIDFPAASELWVPLALDSGKARRDAHYLGVIGRLASGTTLPGARAEMSTIAAALARQFPADDGDWSVLVDSLQDLLVADVRPALVTLQVAASLILLLGGVNVANLLLVRMAGRRREIAVRSALGAGRWRLARQLGAEGILLACAGGALGLLVATWGIPFLLALYPDAVPHPEGVGLHPPVLLFALLVSLAMGVACGVLPAFWHSRAAADRVLRAGGAAAAGGRGGSVARRFLVPAQMALALTLLVGAGLLLKSFGRLQAVDFGFEARGAITARLTLPAARYSDVPRRVGFFRRLVQEIGALPGVEHAATIDSLPLGGSAEYLEVVAEGAQPRADHTAGADHASRGSMVSPDYFRTLRIPLLAGRVFTPRDDLTSPPVVILSRLAATRLWPGQSPLGRRVTFGKVPDRPEARWWTVVGVVGDVRDTDPATAPEVETYISQFQLPPSRAALIVRSAGDPRRLVGTIRRTLRHLDPDLPLDHVQTLDEVVAGSLGGTRVKTVLLGLFASLAVGLAALGVYGLIGQAVAERRREMSLRIALGAQRRQILQLMFRQGMIPVAAGLALGLPGAYAFSRFLASQLYQVGATDAATWVGLVLLLAAVAALATWLPARPATRADPMDALRHE
jgi:predicted permease